MTLRKYLVAVPRGLMQCLVTTDFWDPGGSWWKDVVVPRAFPEEFRRDVVAVARRREAPQKQIAEDFGISLATLSNWLRQADVEDGEKPGVTREQAQEVRELRRRNRLLEQENEVLRRAAAYLSQANLKLGGHPK